MSALLYLVMYVSFAIGFATLGIMSYWFVEEFVKNFITEWINTDAAKA
jgi:hypothetical protein